MQGHHSGDLVHHVLLTWRAKGSVQSLNVTGIEFQAEFAPHTLQTIPQLTSGAKRVEMLQALSLPVTTPNLQAGTQRKVQQCLRLQRWQDVVLHSTQTGPTHETNTFFRAGVPAYLL